MSHPMIRVEGLGKRYRKGAATRERYRALRDVLSWNSLAAGVGLDRDKGRNEFWALRDVAFEVGAGEVMGIIGHNGAGKSTLLKILSRVTAPTEGRVILEGRVGALLEVGTGFHPELTGRENIYLSGAILGMDRGEIRRRFDAIVDFAAIGDFLDTPVKRYSSGMRVRLGFSVAAHLEPEILLVDEVLAVGDYEFKLKCLQRLREFSNKGNAVLVISHDMKSIIDRCKRTIVLRDGQIEFMGNSKDAVDYYLKSINRSIFTSLQYFTGSIKNGFILTNFKINSVDLSGSKIFVSGLNDIIIESCFRVSIGISMQINLAVYSNGVRLFTIQDSKDETVLNQAEVLSTFTIPARTLRPGLYTMGIGGSGLFQFDKWFWCRDICAFEVIEEYDSVVLINNYGVFNIDPLGAREIISND